MDCFFRFYGGAKSERVVNRKHSRVVLPSDVQKLLRCIRRAGFSVWVVGGAVRDFLLGLLPKDWDLATNASPQDIIGLFDRVIPVGIRHGTVQVLTGRRSVEVTSYAGTGREGIVDDLERRDFTVNAIALAYPSLELIDPFGGQRDIQAAVLRGVGDARARFREDPIRTLRACRFVSVYGFSVEQNTFDALKGEVQGLASVAVERIREEMFKFLLGDYLPEAFELMNRSGAVRIVLPEILEGPQQESNSTARQKICEHLVRCTHFSQKRLRLRLAALFHDVAKLDMRTNRASSHQSTDHRSLSAQTAFEILMRWRSPKNLAIAVNKLIESHISVTAHEWSDGEIRRLMSELSIDLMTDLLDLAYADRSSQGASSASLGEIELLRQRVDAQRLGKPALQIADLAVDGDDLMYELGLAPGPVVGKILRELHIAVLEQPALNERRALIQHARKCIQNITL